MKRGIIFLMALLAIFLPTLVARAQAPDEEAPPPPGSRSEVLRRISMLRIYKLTETLELSEEDAARLFPILQRYDRQLQDIMEKKEQFLEELQRELQREKPDDVKLQKLVDDILALEREAMRLRTEQFKELRKVLTAEQYAKFLIFDHQFREDINRMLDDIRRQRPPRRGRPHPGTPPPE